MHAESAGDFGDLKPSIDGNWEMGLGTWKFVNGTDFNTQKSIKEVHEVASAVSDLRLRNRRNIGGGGQTAIEIHVHHSVVLWNICCCQSRKVCW